MEFSVVKCFEDSSAARFLTKDRLPQGCRAGMQCESPGRGAGCFQPGLVGSTVGNDGGAHHPRGKLGIIDIHIFQVRLREGLFKVA